MGSLFFQFIIITIFLIIIFLLLLLLIVIIIIQNIPEHAIPASFFQIQFLGVSPAAGKQSSIVTIFAIWNTMMGTSLLSMPWALEQAGLVMGLLMMVLIP